MNLELKILQAHNIEEFTELITVFEDVFEMKNFRLPSKLYLQKLLNKETFVAVIAKENDRIIGGLTVYLLDQYYTPKPIAYIYDLAVIRTHQRKGVGRKLIAFTKSYCIQKGYEELFVQAEKADEYATDFYRTTLPTEELEVLHFSYNLKG